MSDCTVGSDGCCVTAGSACCVILLKVVRLSKVELLSLVSVSLFFSVVLISRRTFFELEVPATLPRRCLHDRAIEQLQLWVQCFGCLHTHIDIPSHCPAGVCIVQCQWNLSLIRTPTGQKTISLFNEMSSIYFMIRLIV